MLPTALNDVGHLGVEGRAPEPVFEPGREGFEPVVGRVVAEQSERRQAGGHGQGVARERPGLEDRPGGRDVRP